MAGALILFSQKGPILNHMTGNRLVTNTLHTQQRKTYAKIALQLTTDGILKFCLRDCLGECQRATLFKLLDVLSCICDEVQHSGNLEDLKTKVNIVCAEVERDFPISIQVI